MSFHELGLSEPLLRAVAAEGYGTPTPIQSQVIPLLLAGRDVLGSAQTGTGKTAAFALPLLHRLMEAVRPGQGRRPTFVRALVLSPTRELASQIGDSFRTYGRHTNLRFATIYGGVGQSPQVRAVRQGLDVLVATPGRLIDLIDQGFVDLGRVETFILDEADRMLDMGFLPSIRRILAMLPARRQTVLLSATMPEAIIGLANSMLRDPARVQIKPVKATADLIDQSVCYVARHHKPEVLAAFLNAHIVERALVFTRTKRGADRVVQQLARSGIRAEAIHGNKSQSVRQRALANFKSRRTRILVATDIAARGIDVEGISHVFNYDLPQEPETYVHRIGRTGRAGACGIAVSLCDPEERGLLSAIERVIRMRLDVDPTVRQTQSNAPIQDNPTRNDGPPAPKPAGSRSESTANNSTARRSHDFSPYTIKVVEGAGQEAGVRPAKSGRRKPTKAAGGKRRSSRRSRRANGPNRKGVSYRQATEHIRQTPT